MRLHHSRSTISIFDLAKVLQQMLLPDNLIMFNKHDNNGSQLMRGRHVIIRQQYMWLHHEELSAATTKIQTASVHCSAVT